MQRGTNQLQSLVIITGMSGSGKHTAFKAFEDLGYFCVDNLPTSLISRLVQMSTASGGEIQRLAIVIDVRLGESLAGFEKLFGKIKQLFAQSTIIFVDASDEILARRYSETRRVHPLAHDQSLLEAIRTERKKVSSIRAQADQMIDTSEFSVHDLRNFIYQSFQLDDQEDTLNVSVVSFGFKYGIPYNSELVFDVRFLPNPNFEPNLKERTGYDSQVVEYMREQPETGEILSRIYDMLEYLLPKYTREGKKYLTISIGCTGGRHRSVVVANELGKRLKQAGRKVNLIHRDLHNQ
ncbi:RNase adapter RapZ [Acidobacteria bacterium AH-259-D05]|nr:RNase adapter RapZ [Acidobacteria bacterium AH-259-D05]